MQEALALSAGLQIVWALNGLERLVGGLSRVAMGLSAVAGPAALLLRKIRWSLVTGFCGTSFRVELTTGTLILTIDL